MKKSIYGLVAGLTLLSSASFAKDLDIFVHRNHDIIQVANKEAKNKNYAGDVFYHYRKDKDEWILDKITWRGNGRYRRDLVRKDVKEEEIPTYVDGIHSLYYDSDQDEESIVAVFDSIDLKVMDEWIKIAKEHIKELNQE